MTKEEFKKQIRRHDWYFHYSDDHRVWTRGNKELKKLRHAHAVLNCPFSLNELSNWRFNMIFELFQEDEENKGDYYRIDRKSSFVAPAKTYDLITQEKSNQIENWFKETED